MGQADRLRDHRSGRPGTDPRRARARLLSGGSGGSAAVRVARVHDDPADGDGRRVLVDRLWPRGLRRDGAHLDDWLREVAPSPDLRRWYGHDPQRFPEFARRYRDELARPPQAQALQRLRELAAAGPLTLLTATRRADLSQAAVLAELLRDPGRAATAK